MTQIQLPEEWRLAPLEQCVDILDAQRIPVNSKERQQRIQGKPASELYPYYGATGEVGKIDDYLFDEQLVALGEDGVPFLDTRKSKAYMLRGKTWVNNHAHVLRASCGVTLNSYLLLYLNQFDYQGYVNGGTRLKLTQANMRKMPVALAPIAEQKVIAAKLDTLLAQVENTKARLERIPQILKRFRQSVLAAAVSGRLTEEWRSGDNPDRCFKKLGDAGVEVKTGPFGSSLHKSDYVNGGIPVINPMHISEGIITPSESMTISRQKYMGLEAWHLRRGDVVVGRRGEMGRAAVIESEEHQLCGTGSMILRAGINALPKYLEIVLRSPTAVSYFNSASVGSTMVNLNQKVIKNLEVYFPSLDEQAEIVRQVDQLFAHADRIEQQVNNALARVTNLTQSILAKAFRGELTEQWRKDNPKLISGENSAEALLERIKTEQAAMKPVKKVRNRKTTA
jgi:type I restriction enzyme S subunit